MWTPIFLGITKIDWEKSDLQVKCKNVIFYPSAKPLAEGYCRHNVVRPSARITKFGVQIPLMENLLGIVYGLPWPTFKVTGQLCEFHHVNGVATITLEANNLGSRNLVCRYLSWKACLGSYMGRLDLLKDHRGQLCEFHHINNVTTITQEGDGLGSPNLVCRYPS